MNGYLERTVWDLTEFQSRHLENLTTDYESSYARCVDGKEWKQYSKLINYERTRLLLSSRTNITGRAIAQWMVDNVLFSAKIVCKFLFDEASAKVVDERLTEEPGKKKTTSELKSDVFLKWGGRVTKTSGLGLRTFYFQNLAKVGKK